VSLIILGIDPGPDEAALVHYEDERVIEAENVPNMVVLQRLRDYARASTSNYGLIAIERPRSNFRPVSNAFLDMTEWVGRFREAIELHRPRLSLTASSLRLIPFRDIAGHITGNQSAKEIYVRQTLKERFGDVGTKNAHGPMWCMKGLGEHVWSALAVAVTCGDSLRQERGKEVI
jgi:hypothetical protein